MILRISEKLNAKLGVGKLNSRALDENPYADWSWHLFTADRTQYILVTNTVSLYSIGMYGRGIPSDSHFISRVLSELREFLEYEGHLAIYEQFIAPSSAEVVFAKSLNRSVTGSMNDLVKAAKYWLKAQHVSPVELGRHLNRIPMSALKTFTQRTHGVPAEVFLVLQDGSHPNLTQTPQE